MLGTSPAMLEAARDAVAAAGSVCRAVQRTIDSLRAMIKDDRSPVTVADFASQAVVARILSERVPGFRLVAEESGEVLRRDDHAPHLQATIAAVQELWPETTERDLLAAIDLGAADTSHGAFWTLDPVDGTKGFLRGEQYCISLAYIEDGTPTLAALCCPNLSTDFTRSFDDPDPRGTLYLGTRGEGVYELPADEPGAHPVRLRRLDHADGDPISLCESVESAHSDQSASARILERLGNAAPPARLDSQCKYAVVARGQADVYLRLPVKRGYVERIWDHAAGALIAAEAGCAVSDLDGHELDFSTGRGLERNRGVLVAPPRLHGRILAALREAAPPAR